MQQIFGNVPVCLRSIAALQKVLLDRLCQRFSFSNSARLIGLLMLTIGISPLSFANSPFYFVAKVAPVGSMTSLESNQQQVYLRWDLLEGQLPSDIVSFKLYRNGSEFGVYPASGHMSATEIRGLYSDSAQQRRLLETVTLLKAEANSDPNIEDFSINDYPNRLATKLSNDLYWGALSSRRDFNIARARYRADIDVAGAGTVTYELMAVNSSDEERRVGLFQLDTNTTQELLEIEDFDQVQLSQCDVPDMQDHYSVALNWSALGKNNIADQVANQIFVGGYDLYRSKANLDSAVTSAPERQLAKEAIGLTSKSDGSIDFADLEKVNETLITVIPDRNAGIPEWLETQADLVSANLKPGDRRAYYLVPRDFTGNLGPTSAAIVTVGDMARPPTPWDLQVFLNESSQLTELSFERIGLDPWLESYGSDRLICNYDEASGVLSYVDAQESCTGDFQRRVHLKADNYLLYRFEDFAAASAFKDSDGDGFSDQLERPAETQCLPAENVGGALVESEFEIRAFDNHERVILSDETPAANKGDIYWYRVAAVSMSGRLSFLSEPIRVNFPDRALPESPVVESTIPANDGEVCSCEVDYAPEDPNWRLSIDEDLPASFTLTCGSQSFPSTLKDLFSETSSSCLDASLTSACSGSVAKSFSAADQSGAIQCDVALPVNTAICDSGELSISAVACETIPASDGLVTGPLVTTVTPQAGDECVSIFRQISGTTVKVATSCGEADASLEYTVESGEFCGYAVSHDQNNNISLPTYIPCREVQDESDAQATLIAPRVNDLQLNDTDATVLLDLPRQKGSVLEVELQPNLEQEATILRETIAIPDPNTQFKTVQFTLPELLTGQEQWCARARVFGKNADLGSENASDWSALSCSSRSAGATVRSNWLPWPQTTLPVRDQDLVARLNSDWGTLPFASPLGSGIHVPLALGVETACNITPNTVSLFGDVGQADVESGGMLANAICEENERSQLNAYYEDQLNFIVFRQELVEGVESDWVQVTPLIDYVHWSEAGSEKGILRYRLKDPYIWVSVSDVASPEVIDISYVDRTALIAGKQYRYEFVYFDQNHALSSWRRTQWIQLPDSTTSSQGGE